MYKTPKNLYYKLVDRKPVEITNMNELEEAWDEKKRRVGSNIIDGYISVSTVFLPINHAFGPGPPVLFETMIFGGKHDQYQDRYCTWEQAEAGHLLAIELVKNTPRLEKIKYYLLHIFYNIKNKIKNLFSAFKKWKPPFNPFFSK